MAKEMLLKEIEFLKLNVSNYIVMYNQENAQWSPDSRLRSLLSLTNHICGLPSVAVAILNGEPEETVFALDEPVKENSTEAFLSFFQNGCEELSSLLTSLTIDEFLNKPILNPFGGTSSPEKISIDTITHLYHHRGQLHNYLKMLGQPISTETLFNKD